MGATEGGGLRERVRIGTRRSKLSLWQANHVADLLQARQPELQIEIRQFSTRGDANPNTPLPAIGVKGIFTSTLEEALRRGEIDCAVHSLKDMPVEMAADLALAAVPKRGDHRDALVSAAGLNLADLPRGARIGTGSLRRKAQLLALRQDLKILPIRGNVPTRLDKLYAPGGEYDALALAAAGLKRLGLAAHINQVFSDAQLLCAAGQGALAVQCLNDAPALEVFGKINDVDSELATRAERAFLGRLEQGCSLPVAAHAQVSGGRLGLRARVLAEDGSQMIDLSGETEIAGEKARAAALELGAKLAEEALDAGADRLLATQGKG